MVLTKRSKKEKVDKKDRKEKKDKSKKSKKAKTDATEPQNEEDGIKTDKKEAVKPVKALPIHDLISLEHSISVIQENLKKIIDLAPDGDDLTNYINSLVSSSINGDPEKNGDVTAKLLLLSKSHKIQLAAQLKSLYNKQKLTIFDQIMNFNDQTILDSADDVQLLLKEKKQKAYEKSENAANSSASLTILPKLPIIYDSVLEAKVFVHKSATNGDLHSSKYDQVQSNNERLEYLGDAVLEAVVSDIIESKYNDFDEGQLSLLRSTLVKNETIEIISRAYKFPERQQKLLDSHVIKTDLSINAKFRNNKRIADLFEAYIGALFIEKGRNGEAYDFIKSWLMQVYTPVLTEFESSDRAKYTHLSKNLVSRLLNNSPTSTCLPKTGQVPASLPCKVQSSVPELKQACTTTDSTSTLQQSKSTDSAANLQFPITVRVSEEVNKLAKGELYALVGCAKLHPVYETIQHQNNVRNAIVQCSIGGDILGLGEGKNIKDASARAAQASLLNKPMIEKYHLIRMMTPREETKVSSNFEKITPDNVHTKFDTTELPFIPKVLKSLPYSLTPSQIPSPDSSAKMQLTELCAKRNLIPQITCEQDKTTKSVLPVFKTTLQIGKTKVVSCIDASKKKGANKVSQWLLDAIKEHGQEIVFHDLRVN